METIPPAACAEQLASRYDGALLDLDGVVYIGDRAVPAVDVDLAAAHAAGMRLAYVTNNAARTPVAVAAHLARLGIPVAVEDVVTSSQAAASVLLERVGAGAEVFVMGGEGLFEALAERGLRGTQEFDGGARAVVSGYHPDLRWGTVIDASILVGRGLPWVATNTDLTIPTRHGEGPGNGALVAAVAAFSGRAPVVAGKPEPVLFHETQRRLGLHRPLVVGDRLDTDIEGAARAGLDSLLVMTGVTGLAELAGAEPGRRPTYLADTLAGLTTPHSPIEGSHGVWQSGGWRAEVAHDDVVVSGEGSADDWWRVVAAAAWGFSDACGRRVGLGRIAPPR
jgi:HAD superfamily hydrolase (TIGR01450 family)